MIRLFANASYDFIKWRRVAFSVTGGIMLIGAIFLVTRGLNYSIEFTGGTSVQFEVAHRVETGNIRAALDQVGLRGADIYNFGSDTSYQVRARLGKNASEGGPRAAGKSPPRHPGQLPRDADLSRGPVRMALWSGGRHRDRARHRRDHRLHQRHASRSESRRRRGGADRGRILAQRHDHHLRPRARKPTQIPSPESVRDPQSLDQRNVAAVGADARDHDRDHTLAPDPRGRGDPAVRLGHVVRNLHRHVLIDLHRGARAALDREALAR